MLNWAGALDNPKWKVPFFKACGEKGVALVLRLNEGRKKYSYKYPFLKALSWVDTRTAGKGKVVSKKRIHLVQKFKVHFHTCAIAGLTPEGLYRQLTVVFWKHIIGDHSSCGDACKKSPPPIMPNTEREQLKLEAEAMAALYTRTRRK